MKTLSELYEELEEVKRRELILQINYYNQTYDMFIYPNRIYANQKLDIIVVEFKNIIDEENIKRVYQYLKKSYEKILFDVKLVSPRRIHIYTPSQRS